MAAAQPASSETASKASTAEHDTSAYTITVTCPSKKEAQTSKGLEYDFLAMHALHEETGMDFEIDNPSIPPLVDEMTAYLKSRATSPSYAQVMRKMRLFVRRKMLCGKRIDDESSDEEGEGEDTRAVPAGDQGTSKAATKTTCTNFVDREEIVDESYFDGDENDGHLLLRESKWLVLNV